MKKINITHIIMVFCMASSCLSDVYLAHPDSHLGDFFYNGLRNYYDSQPDIDYVFMKNMMPANLSDYDMYATFGAGIDSDRYQYSTSEIADLNDYLQSGGRLLFFTDAIGTGFGEYIDPYLNQLLPQLGSNMTLKGGLFDGGGHHDSIPGQILDNPFTHDVDLIRFAAVNSIVGGTQTLLASNLTDCFFSYEKIGNGYIFLSGDVNLMDFADDPSYDNGQFFRNLGEVPEPATMCLLGLGGLMLRRRGA